MKRVLPERLAGLAMEAVANHRPELIPLVLELESRPLTAPEREGLRDALLKELLHSGLAETDEPTSRGLDLEELIDRVGHL